MENKVENGEIIGLRNHVTYILEQTWGILAVIAAILFSNSDSFDLALRLFSEGNVLKGILALGGVVVVLLLACIWNINRWYKTTITVKDGTVTIQRLTMNRYVNTIAVQNISNINLEQNLFEIAVGTYKLKLDTNSLSTASRTDVKIVLGKKDAYRVKNLIMNMMKEIQMAAAGQQLGEAGFADSPSHNEIDMMEEKEESFYDVVYNGKQIVINCLVNTSIILFLLSIGFLVSAIVSVVMTWGSDTSLAAVIGGILIQVIMAGSMVTALVKSWLNDFNFRAKRYKDKIYVSCGLIKRKKYAVPVDKINAVCLCSGFLGRLFNRFYVKVINVGGEGEDVDGMKLLLSGKPGELKEKLKTLLPEFTFPEEKKMQRQPAAVLVKKLVQCTIIFSILCMGVNQVLSALSAVERVRLFGTLGTGVLGLLFLIGCLLSYRVNRFCAEKEYLLIAHGMFGKKLVSIPYDKIQYLHYVQGPFERLLHVKRAEVSILASSASQKQWAAAFDVGEFEELDRRFRETC